MDYYIMSNELYHYGVKGMKWGRRKKIETLAKKSAMSYSTAKSNKKDINEVSSSFKNQANTYKKWRNEELRDPVSINTKNVARYNKNIDFYEKRSQNVAKMSKSYVDGFIKKAERQKQKAYDLAMKEYGSNYKSEVDRMIQSYGDIPYTNITKNFKDQLHRGSY